ncbi:DUF3276 family protein [Archaeoglobus sp.]
MVGEKKELFSKKIGAGKRTYFIDIKESQDGTKYLVITESKETEGGNYERNRIMVFEEYLYSFVRGLKEALEFYEKERRAKKYSVEEVRLKYPRAYMKWTKEEDDALRKEYLEGKTIDDLSRIFQRKPSAICSRLQKLGVLREE